MVAKKRMLRNSLHLLVLKFILWNWSVILWQTRHRLINRLDKCLPYFDSVLKHWKKAILILFEYIFYKNNSELSSRCLQTLQASLVPFKFYHFFPASSHCYQYKSNMFDSYNWNLEYIYIMQWNIVIIYSNFIYTAGYLQSINKQWKIKRIMNARKSDI